MPHTPTHALSELTKDDLPDVPCMSSLVICHLSLGANIYIVFLQRFNAQKKWVRRRLVQTLIV